MNFRLRNTPKGDIMSMLWKKKHVRDYIGPGLPSAIIEKLQQHKYHWKYINVLVDHDIPLKKLKLYNGLTNWCACGIQDLGRNDFFGYVAELQHGMIKKDF